MRSKAKIFSFFAGVGLLDLGFEHEGFEVCYVNEFHKPFLKAYIHARQKMDIKEPEFGYYNGSIENLLPRSLTEAAKSLLQSVQKVRSDKEVVGFLGGPPCPDFSVGGKNKGSEGENGKLTATYIELIVNLLPDFFVFENVKGLWRTHKHKAFYNQMLLELEKAGYVIEDRLTNSIEFGVPQDRERIIIIGVLKKNLEHDKEKLDVVWSGLKYPGRKAFEEYQWIQEEEFIVDSSREKPPCIPEELTVEYWFKKNNVDSHPNSTKFFTPRAGLEKFLVIREGDDGKKSFKRLHRWRYSPTAAYGNNEVHLHPYKARRLSVAEVLAIQSAPIQFELPDDMTLSNMFKTLGNAVPYLMARGIACSVESILVRANGKLNSKRLGRRDSDSGYWEELPVREWTEFNPVATD